MLSLCCTPLCHVLELLCCYRNTADASVSMEPLDSLLVRFEKPEDVLQKHSHRLTFRPSAFTLLHSFFSRFDAPLFILLAAVSVPDAAAVSGG